LANHLLMQYIIDTGDVILPYSLIYKLLENELKILKDYLDENFERGYIQRFINSVGALILFVFKKDGGFHLCVDYRGLNKITVKNRHSFFLMREILDRLNGAAVYTKFDLKNIYYRIRIREGDE
jgi:hypothetical protein